MNGSEAPPPGPDTTRTRPLPRVTPAPPLAPPPPVSAPRARKAPAAPNAFVARYGNALVYLLVRSAAFVVDVPLLAFVAACFTYGQLNITSRAMAAGVQSGFGFIVLAALGGALVFQILCEGIVGTTLGKALFALHVHRARGGYAGLGRAVLRGIVRPIDLVAIGPILALLPPRHQRLGDFAARTTVARSPAGFVAPLVALVLLGGIGYAEVAFGGGIDSAIAVSSEAAILAPQVRDGGLNVLATVVPGLVVRPAPAPSPTTGATPASSGPPAFATPEGSASGSPPEAGAASSKPEATFPPGDESPAAAATPAGLATPAEAPTPSDATSPNGENRLATPAPEQGATRI